MWSVGKCELFYKYILFKDSFFSLLFINRDLEDLSPPQSSGQDSNKLAWLIAGEDFTDVSRRQSMTSHRNLEALHLRPVCEVGAAEQCIKCKEHIISNGCFVGWLIIL
jgi:hypothetical protein